MSGREGEIGWFECGIDITLRMKAHQKSYRSIILDAWLAYHQ